MAQKPALGKGLASLFPGVPHTTSAANPSSRIPAGAEAAGRPTPAPSVDSSSRDRIPAITFAGLDEIQVNQYQPRRDFFDESLDELAQSIRENGIIQPLVVRKTNQGYQLIAGERRLRAAKIAGLKQVPIVVRRSTDREALELALIENIQRENLNCIDEALAYFQLVQDFSLTQEEVAKRVGKDRATVANYLRLLRLPEAIIDDLKRQILSFGHGKALLSTDDNDIRLFARQQIVEKRLSVRDTEALVEELKRKAQGEASTSSQAGEMKGNLTPVQSRLSKLSQELTRQLSTRVEMKGTERRGKIIIHYTNRDELERILGAVQNKEVWPGQ